MQNLSYIFLAGTVAAFNVYRGQVDDVCEGGYDNGTETHTIISAHDNIQTTRKARCAKFGKPTIGMVSVKCRAMEAGLDPADTTAANASLDAQWLGRHDPELQRFPFSRLVASTPRTTSLPTVARGWRLSHRLVTFTRLHGLKCL